MNTTVEVRLPKSDWNKSVTAVDARAKTGHGWSGEFLPKEGKLVDLTPGDLFIECDEVGSRKHPRKRARLNIVLPNGKIENIAEVSSNEWAIELRGIAREWLEKDTGVRIVDAAKIRAERFGKDAAVEGASESTKELASKAAQNVAIWTAKYGVATDVPAPTGIVAEILALRPKYSREKLEAEPETVLAHILATAKEADRLKAAYAM